MRRMSSLVLGLAALAPACGGGGGSQPIDAALDGPTVDAPTIDAPVDAPIDAPAASCTPRNGTTITLTPVATGLDNPVGVTSPPGDRRVFVVEQTGAIRLFKNDTLVTAPYLNLGGNTGPVMYGGERGLLGLAFHPQFAQNGKFYVNFTAKAAGTIPAGATVIAEFTVSDAAADVANVGTSRRDLLVIPQPYANHNGGWIEFGNDGLLYVGMGDGGSAGDPEDRAQNDASMLGKMLRIDVNGRTGTKQYAIPAGNPFAASADGPNDPRPENWHKGLRNPFRWSFDRPTGDLYIGDVGQGTWEEVDYTTNGAPLNFGWDDREGAHCYEPMNGCLTAGRTDPVTEHQATTNWHSVIGGQVYRGTCFPDLVGRYFYGDYVAGELWSLKIMGGAATTDRRELTNVGNLTHIHADSTGELWVINLDGRVRKLAVQ